jgi:hypothetical protein
LVHGLNIVCEPGGDDRTCAFWHLRRHRTRGVPAFVMAQIVGILAAVAVRPMLWPEAKTRLPATPD